MNRKMLRDDQWERIEHLLPGKAGDPGLYSPKDNRRFVEAVLWVMRTGSPWRETCQANLGIGIERLCSTS